jgi:hypothetical protein
MYRAWFAMLFCGLIGLAAPASVLADQASINVQPDGVKAEAVYVVNQSTTSYVLIAILVVSVVLVGLVGLVISQLGGIKTALEKPTVE